MGPRRIEKKCRKRKPLLAVVAIGLVAASMIESRGVGKVANFIKSHQEKLLFNPEGVMPCDKAMHLLPERMTNPLCDHVPSYAFVVVDVASSLEVVDSSASVVIDTTYR